MEGRDIAAAVHTGEADFVNDYRSESHRIQNSWVLTGDPRKPPWSELAPVGELTLSHGHGEPSQLTRVWTCWDDRHFYVAFWCEDTDIRATFTQRNDKVWQEEAAEFFVSPDGDLKNYFEFQFSPRNVVRDIRVSNPNGRMAGSGFDGEWNCLDIRSAVYLRGVINEPSIPDEGWGLEVALPFVCLLGEGKTPTVGTEWRINFFRIYRHPVEEFCSWVPTLIEPWEFHVPAMFGHLVFVD